MTVIHTVLFKYKAGLGSERMEAIKAGFEKLKEIPAVKELSFGPTFTERGQGFTHMLVVKVENRQALII